MQYVVRAALISLVFAFATPAAAMKASWYGVGDGSGVKTASGTRFNPKALEVAHPTWPFGTRVLITYKGKSVCARVTDRGPFVRGRGIDVTYGVAKRLGFVDKGVVELTAQKGGC